MDYQVNDIFHSVQGEGVHAGRLSTFVRLQGCPVGCSWCDAGPFYHPDDDTLHVPSLGNTWGKKGNRVMTAEEIAMETTYKIVIITGGEPIIHDLDPLMKALRKRGRWISLETSGYQDFIGQERPNWITWSPKANLNFKAPQEIVLTADEIKIVVDDAIDFETVVQVWGQCTVDRFASMMGNMGRLFTDPEGIFPWMVLMPEGCPPRPEIVKKTIHFLEMIRGSAHEPFWRFGDRLQYRIGVK